MLFTPHIVSGMMFGSLASNPGVSFVLGFLSYFILELIPHWDPEHSDKKRISLLRYFDTGLALISFILVVMIKELDKSYIVGGLTSAIIFIFFQFLHFLPKNNTVLSKLYYLKTRMTYKDKSAWGIMIQVAVCIISLAVMFQLIDFPTFDKIASQLF